MATETRNPETAVIGLDYHEGTYDGANGRCTVRLRFAPWVTANGRDKATFDLAGLNRKTGVWAGRIEDLQNLLYRADFDGIAGIDPSTNRYGSGQLDAAGVRVALALIEERKAPKSSPALPEPVECLECGQVYPADQAHRVRSHRMACDRCGK